MSAHGPDAVTYEKASACELSPHYFDGGLAFMFESHLMMKLTDHALDGDHLDRDYYKCWSALKNNFDPTNGGKLPSTAKNMAEWRREREAAATQ